jgi:hypothetical protein
MAYDMLFWVIDEATIARLRKSPDQLAAFLAENEPAASGPNQLNTDLFHFILNGTDDHVDGIKGIFEDLEDTGAISIGEEATAITGEANRRLLEALQRLDDATMRKRWSQLKRRRGLEKDYPREQDLDDEGKERWRKIREEDYRIFPAVLAELKDACEQALGQNHGLLWTWG